MVAPAGYGKTTAVAQWVEGQPAPHAWISLDRRDDDPSRLTAHLLAATARALPNPSTVPREALDAGADPADVVVPLLVGDLERRLDGDGLVLVLDDGHAVRSAASHDLLEQLLAALPEGVRTVIVGRPPLPISLARRRAAGTVAEIGPAALRFTLPEVEAFVNGALGLSQSDEQLRRLTRATDGWPAALSLAVASRSADPAALVPAAATTGEIAEYLLQEVLTCAGEPMRRFLRRTSILSRLEDDLCVAVADDPEAGEHLRTAWRASLLIARDDDDAALRYHHLLTTLLQAELRRSEPQLIPELHRRAAAWHRRRGDHEQAAEHAIRAGDPQLAAAILSEAWFPWLFVDRRPRAVLALLDRLPGDPGPWRTFVEALRLACEALELGVGRPERRRLAELSARPPRPERASTAVLDALRRSPLFGDVRGALAACAADPALPPPDRRTRHALGIQRALVGWFAGDRTALAWLEQEPPPDGGLTMRVWRLALLTLFALDGDDIDAAVRHGRAAVAEVDAVGDDDLACSIPAYQACAAALGRAGDLDAAEAMLARAWTVTARLPTGVDHLLTLTIAAGLALGRNQHDRARAHAQAARAIVDDCADLGALARKLEQIERAIGDAFAHPLTGTPLSRAEQRILALLPGPASAAEIAGDLHLSPNTVRTHVRRIYRRLGVSSRGQAVAAARARGLL
ncbi:LuxR C-terminal-related transcriptional regulator [Patulibacter defluvii]|uniref:LuxR C-terminal-related transcriptional regulator n=1 Tax=Patulibacter defluvii TaxID=3095358 RepID=UPI002A7648B7|nr:LuxR C-terminal-related transcriptional regulator [Patulibacter sp. DM4]